MKILMATMQLDIGGAETHIVELSKALKKRGLEIYVASNGGAYVKELEDAGIKHFDVPLNRKSVSAIRKAYRELKKIIFENDIDIVHAHARIPGFLCALLQKKYKFRFVTTAHWVFSTRFPFNLLTRWGMRSLAVSDDIKQYLIDNYDCREENIRITINGVDTEKFSDSIDWSDVAAEFGFGENKKRVVYVSRMDTDRSLAAHKLIEAVPELKKQIPDLEIVIVGGGNDFEKINQEAETANREVGERCIIVTGGRTDINKFAASGDVFVGVSRAALEAMACKKPAIIAGNEGYIGIFDQSKLEVAIDTNFCCRGCDETTTEGLCEDLIQLLKPENEELRRTLGEYSLETVKKYYSVDTMASDAIKMYISAIKGDAINEVSDSLDGIEKYLICKPGRRDVDIAISGYYGFNNSGDDAILSAILNELKSQCPNISATVLSQNPNETAAEYDVRAIDRFDIFEIVALLKRTKLLISGGGSLIQDVTSSKSLYYYIALIWLAKFCGAKVMLYANGIGPVNKKINRRLVKAVLKKVDYITLREESSKKELERIVSRQVKCMVTADPVFAAELEADDEANVAIQRAGIGENEKFFVVSVREWDTLEDEFENKICEFCDWVYQKYNVKPFVIPMQSIQDANISEEIETCISVPHGVCRDGYPPEIMMGIIRKAEFVVGMRLHTLIYAVKEGVPGIALDYDPKVAAVMKSIDLRYSQKIEDVDVDKLCEFADEIMESRDELRGKIREKSQRFSELAKKNTEIVIRLLTANEK